MRLTSKIKLWILAIAGVFVCGAAVVTTYHHTKSAYRAVGVNDGIIDANTRMLERLLEITGKISVCSSEQLLEGKKIAAVKAEAIYAIAKDLDTISLCWVQ